MMKTMFHLMESQFNNAFVMNAIYISSVNLKRLSIQEEVFIKPQET